MQKLAKRRQLTINHAIQSHLKCPLFQRVLNKPRSKGVTTPSRTQTYHFSRTLSKELALEGGLILKPVMSRQLKDANLPLITDALKGTVLEKGLILQLVISGRLKGF